MDDLRHSQHCTAVGKEQFFQLMMLGVFSICKQWGQELTTSPPLTLHSTQSNFRCIVIINAEGKKQGICKITYGSTFLIIRIIRIIKDFFFILI